VRGQASWPRNPATCVSAHALVHGRRGEGESDKAGPRRRERKGDARGQRLGTGEPGPQNRERERAGEVTGADRLGPLGNERERGLARARTVVDRRGPPVRRRGRAAWLGLVGRLGCFHFPFSLDFLIPFLFLFL
jgi:hypothetical protein